MAGKGKRGRPPALSPHAQAEITRRLAAGEKAIDLAKEFKVSRSLVSALFSGRIPIIQNLASQLAVVEGDISNLSIPEQNSVRTLADQLRGIQNNLSQAALNGSKTNRILSGIAVKQATKLDEDKPDAEKLKTIAQLSVTGNEASRVATTLVTAASKERKDEDGTLKLEDLLGS